MAWSNFDKNSDEWKRGQDGVKIARAWLQSKGKFVIPVDAIENGGAPMLEGLIRKYTLPDLLAASNGVFEWYEVKYKGRATLYQKRGREEHGIAAHQFQGYLEVQKRTGTKGFLAIIQTDKWRLLIAPFDDLATDSRIYDGTKHYGKPEIYFPVSLFKSHDVSSYAAEMGLEGGPEPKTVRPWEIGKVVPNPPPTTDQLPLF